MIVPLAGMRRLLPPASYWRMSQLTVSRGQDIGELQSLLEKLVAMGFERVDMVSSPGEVSVRGGIIDIYPLTESDPLRIELFDTEIDSIRTFSIDDGTITLAANALIEHGAKEVYACCTHPVLSGPAIERIKNSKIKELVVTNSIVLPEERQIDKIKMLSVGPLMAEAIQ